MAKNAAGGGRRHEILRKAAQIFLKHGYEATSMKLVAEHASVTKPGLYYHFKSKQDLLYSIISHAMDDLEKASIEATLSTNDNEERLRLLLYKHALMIEVGEGAFTLLVIDETHVLSEEDRRLITQRKRSYFELIKGTLGQLRKEGKLRDANLTIATFSLLGMVMWISKWYQADGPMGHEAVAWQVTELALAAVLRDDRRSLPPFTPLEEG
jgi:AcrR family transcriptional regulator